MTEAIKGSECFGRGSVAFYAVKPEVGARERNNPRKDKTGNERGIKSARKSFLLVECGKGNNYSMFKSFEKVPDF